MVCLWPALIACAEQAPPLRAQALERRGAEVLRCRAGRAGLVDLGDLLKKLGERGITSLLVEGGATIHGALVAEGLWDELRLFVAPKILGEPGIGWAALPAPARMADALPVARLSAESVGEDVLLRARPRR